MPLYPQNRLVLLGDISKKLYLALPSNGALENHSHVTNTTAYISPFAFY